MTTQLAQYWMRLIQAGFYLLYHQLAPFYDVISWLVSLGRWRDWQRSVLPYVQGERVLEIGHGPGHMLVALAERGRIVTGIDLSPQMSRLAQNRLRASDSRAGILLSPAQQLPFASCSFDSALATFPAEFIGEQQTLSELHRVLRQDGRLIVLPQARLTGATLPVRLLEFLYAITGQRPAPHDLQNQSEGFGDWRLFLDRLHEVGFQTRIEQIPLPGSEVLLIVATRL
ncbi:MAG: class I SAM-dependent methyltransferase [Candidatus Promineifilaceae bacterium]